MTKPLVIDAEFIVCPDCQGLKYRIDKRWPHRWPCETCEATGRIYFTERVVPWTEVLLDWWGKVPRYIRINAYMMIAFTVLLFGALILLNILEVIKHGQR